MEFARFDKPTGKFIYDKDAFALVYEFREVIKVWGWFMLEGMFLLNAYTSPFNNPNLSRKEKIARVLDYFKRSERSGHDKGKHPSVQEETFAHPVFKDAEKKYNEIRFDQDWDNYERAIRVERTLFDKYESSVADIMDKDGADYTKVLQATLKGATAERQAMEAVVYQKVKDKKGNVKVLRSHNLGDVQDSA
jgi:hemerythrin superfamily protein